MELSTNNLKLDPDAIAPFFVVTYHPVIMKNGAEPLEIAGISLDKVSVATVIGIDGKPIKLDFTKRSSECITVDIAARPEFPTNSSFFVLLQSEDGGWFPVGPIFMENAP